LDLNGVPCTVSDTAGLRLDSSDPIEQEGMRRAR
jgi:tRNA U34 5-carboxymethylaminomethyl modifying GTPase MnmE/TrmE